MAAERFKIGQKHLHVAALVHAQQVVVALCVRGVARRRKTQKLGVSLRMDGRTSFIKSTEQRKPTPSNTSSAFIPST